MLLVAILLTAQLAGNGYTQIHDNYGVKVYKRDGAKGIDFAAEGEIASPPDKVREVLLDYANHPKWVKGLSESTILSRGPFSLIVYQKLTLPIIDDRDYTLLVTWGNEGSSLWMRFMTANDRGPAPRHGVVRVSLHEGSWRLDPIDGGKKTHAVYQFRLDLAGSFPAWMGKGRAGKDIPNLFENVRREAARR